MSTDAARSPRRATHLFLLRQNKVSQKKATRSLGPYGHLAVLGADGNFRNLSAAQPSDI